MTKPDDSEYVDDDAFELARVRALKSIARQIAVLVVRKHRKLKAEEGKKKE